MCPAVTNLVPQGGSAETAVGTFLGNALDRVWEGDSECLGQLPEGQDRNVVLPSLDRSDVGSMDSTPEGEFFLGPATGFPRLAEVPTQPNEGTIFLGHALKGGR